MARIELQKLMDFCAAALIREGLREDYAHMAARVLAVTDGYGTHSHGTKNLHNYIRKFRVGGIDIAATPEIIKENAAFAVMDAHHALGMISSYLGMELACRKAKETGVAIVTVKNSCHFGAAGYYANMAAAEGMIGLSMSNVDPNMTAPGARGMLLGNNPFAYAAPAISTPSIFLDIAMSNVASLKVVQARRDGREIPPTWIVDRDGLPTTDPSHYPEEGAMQPMSAHKGYGLAVMVDLLTGLLSGGGMSMMGDIVSWCFEMEQKNNVCHTFIAVDAAQFIGREELLARSEAMAQKLGSAEKARGSSRIYTPGEIEWEHYRKAEAEGLLLPEDVLSSLRGLSEETEIALPITE